MQTRKIRVLALGLVLIALIATAVISVSFLRNDRAALPLYLGIAAVGAFFVRLVMAPEKKTR